MLRVKTPDEVLEIIDREFEPLSGLAETVGLDSAPGRVLAEDVYAAEDVPGFARSTVDGYALRASETFGCTEALPAMFRLVREVRMGKAADFELGPGECAAVPTGGAIPAGADCAVMLEHAEDYGDGWIGVSKPSAPGRDIIRANEDAAAGQLMFRRGQRLRSQDIGALAALGCAEVEVARRLRVAVISTGDELVSPSETPGEGQIRDVNSPMLMALLREFGAEPVFCGRVGDEDELLASALRGAAESADAVLISGGSSVGKRDAACRVIGSEGKLLLHGVAMKPGKPSILGKVGGKPVFGLPGHPVAAWFVTRLFVLPLLDRLSGAERRQYKVRARLAEPVSANDGRALYMGVRLTEGGDGLEALPVRGKSGLISTLSGSDGFICVGRDCEGLPKGAEVEVTVCGG